MNIHFSPEVDAALSNQKPILALESTIISHGMPYPQNLSFAQKAESLCFSLGVTPATIAIINGEIHVGLSHDLLEIIASSDDVKKVAQHEIGFATSNLWTGATTVSSTMHIAHSAGIQVFATGGIGGVHRGAEFTFDISQDLNALSKIPMVVVSAGAKAILDIPKTVEVLETYGVPILGFQTNEFPAFYSRESGVELHLRADSSRDIASIFTSHLQNDLKSAVLVANPVPDDNEIPSNEMEKYISDAILLAEKSNINGKALTPFLLHQIKKDTLGKSLETNVALALNNVQLGAKIASSLRS